MDKTPIAIFVSGRGSNAQAIIKQQQKYSYKVALLVVSSEKAKAIDLSKKHQIPFLVLNKAEFTETKNLTANLKNQQIELIALAGFLWKIPTYLIKAFPNKILNIHPALLPKYGGKGMYGKHIHQEVFNNKETETGISIHIVNENYDEGKILYQEKVKLTEEDTPETIAEKVLKVEHTSFAKVIDDYLNNFKTQKHEI